MSPTRTPDHQLPRVAVLGAGAMGTALARALLATGRPVVVWNRTQERLAPLVELGAEPAETPAEAVGAGEVVVSCLYDHGSVRDVLEPLSTLLRGRTLVELTTTSPREARELATWSADQGLEYLDGAIMAVPAMIGQPAAQVLYGGSRTAFDTHRELLDTWATSRFEGGDAGRPALLDHAILSGMYVMFSGFLHGAAMLEADGVGPAEFAERATPFLAAMTASFARLADVVEAEDYARAGEQSLAWTDLARFVRVSEEQGVDPAPIAMVARLAQRQIDVGHGSDAFARIFESLRVPAHRGGRRLRQ